MMPCRMLRDALQDGAGFWGMLCRILCRMLQDALQNNLQAREQLGKEEA